MHPDSNKINDDSLKQLENPLDTEKESDYK